MILSMNFQIQLACVGFFLGTVGAFVYDVIRIIRLYIIHSKFVEYLEDYLFWIIYGFVVFLCCLKVNYGEIRPFFLVSLFLAMIIYYFFVANLIHSLMIPLIDFILKMLKMVLGILALPITFLISIIKRLLKFVYAANCWTVGRIPETKNIQTFRQSSEDMNLTILLTMNIGRKLLITMCNPLLPVYGTCTIIRTYEWLVAIT